MVQLDDLGPNRAEAGSTKALLRGVAAGFQKRGHRIGGACVESSVLQGSGLSSSAAFEILTGTILNSHDHSCRRRKRAIHLTQKPRTVSIVSIEETKGLVAGTDYPHTFIEFDDHNM